MKLYKLTVVGTEEDFSINYTSTSDFMNYKSFEIEGSEEEKYVHFLEDLKKWRASTYKYKSKNEN